MKLGVGLEFPNAINANEDGYIIYYHVPETNNFYQINGTAIVRIEKCENSVVLYNPTHLEYNGQEQALVTLTGSFATKDIVHLAFALSLLK